MDVRDGHLCRGDEVIVRLLHVEQVLLELRELPVPVMLSRFAMKGGRISR